MMNSIISLWDKAFRPILIYISIQKVQKNVICQKYNTDKFGSGKTGGYFPVCGLYIPPS